MKKVTVKNCIKTLAQLPVVLILLIAVCIERALVWCMVHLSNPMSMPFAKLGLIPKPGDISIDSEKYERDLGIEFILGLVGGKNAFTLNRVRIELEDTKTGRHVASTYPDRHLYSILKPDRTENLARIQNVLREMDNGAFERVLSNACAMAKLP
ncbi:MAG: hypothetical protein ACYS6W_01310 [Planctomycetota bacterium]|jgi:hypothetical protein